MATFRKLDTHHERGYYLKTALSSEEPVPAQSLGLLVLDLKGFSEGDIKHKLILAYGRILEEEGEMEALYVFSIQICWQRMNVHSERPFPTFLCSRPLKPRFQALGSISIMFANASAISVIANVSVATFNQNQPIRQ